MEKQNRENLESEGDMSPALGDVKLDEGNSGQKILLSMVQGDKQEYIEKFNVVRKELTKAASFDDVMIVKQMNRKFERKNKIAQKY